FDAGDGKIVLIGIKGRNKVAPTVEIDVQLGAVEGDFSPQRLMLEHFSDLRMFKKVSHDRPEGSRLAGATAVLIKATAGENANPERVRLAQWVSQRGKGYARVVAYADAGVYSEMEEVFNEIAASVRLK